MVLLSHKQQPPASLSSCQRAPGTERKAERAALPPTSTSLPALTAGAEGGGWAFILRDKTR